ncbi:hypothetical protein DFH07DRAFT_859799, partial [Mycena maculata]
MRMSQRHITTALASHHHRPASLGTLRTSRSGLQLGLLSSTSGLVMYYQALIARQRLRYVSKRIPRPRKTSMLFKAAALWVSTHQDLKRSMGYASSSRTKLVKTLRRTEAGNKNFNTHEGTQAKEDWKTRACNELAKTETDAGLQICRSFRPGARLANGNQQVLQTSPTCLLMWR